MHMKPMADHEEDHPDRVLLCPPELETATGTFDPAGYDPDDCAGCGATRGEHVAGPDAAPVGDGREAPCSP